MLWRYLRRQRLRYTWVIYPVLSLLISTTGKRVHQLVEHLHASLLIRELKQPRRRRQQKPHKFTYLTMKSSIFARFARALSVIFWHSEDVLVLSPTWNERFCSCVNDVRIWWQMFNFVFSCPKRWFQFNSRIVRTHFSSITSLNNCKIIAETRSYIFRWRCRFRRRRVCLKLPIGWKGKTCHLEGRERKRATWKRNIYNCPFSVLSETSWHTNFKVTLKIGFIKRAGKGRKIWKLWKADVSSVSPSSERKNENFALTKSWRSKRELSDSFTVVIRPLSTRLLKPYFHGSLSRRDTTVSLETRNLLSWQWTHNSQIVYSTTIHDICYNSRARQQYEKPC